MPAQGDKRDFAVSSATASSGIRGPPEWFLTQEVEGEPISKNLADAVATLLLLPPSQRGEAKRVDGPDLRKAV